MGDRRASHHHHHRARVLNHALHGLMPVMVQVGAFAALLYLLMKFPRKGDAIQSPMRKALKQPWANVPNR